MNAEHYAKEAARILADEIFAYALDVVRKDALEALASADFDQITILRLQQKVSVIDDIRSELRGAVSRRPNTANSAGTFA